MCLNGYGATSQPTREQLEEALTEIKGLFELLIEAIFFFFNVSSKWTKVFILATSVEPDQHGPHQSLFL